MSTREIEFRGKDLKGKWQYGAYHKHLPYTPNPIRDAPIPESDYEHCIIQDGFSDWNMPRGFTGFQVAPETVGQFTGLTDKNGVRIFEGDIVRVTVDGFEESIHEVRYLAKESDYPAFDLIPELGSEANGLSWALLSTEYELEVIGNIYDNPELLESENDRE